MSLYSDTNSKAALQTKPSKADLYTIDLQGEEWYNLGQHLGLTDRELKKIKKLEKKLNNRKQQMLKVWLNASPNATWEKLITALEKVNWTTAKAVRKLREEKDSEIERTSLAGSEAVESTVFAHDRNSDKVEGDLISLKPLVSSFTMPHHEGRDLCLLSKKHSMKSPSTTKLKSDRHSSRVEIDSAEHIEEPVFDSFNIHSPFDKPRRPARVDIDDHTTDINMMEPSSKNSTDDDEFLSFNSDSDEHVSQTQQHSSRTSGLQHSSMVVEASGVKGHHQIIAMVASPSQSPGNPRRMAQDCGERDKVYCLCV